MIMEKKHLDNACYKRCKPGIILKAQSVPTLFALSGYHSISIAPLIG